MSVTIASHYCVMLTTGSGWYGYHMPRVRARDEYYAKLEDQRAKEAGIK